MIKQTIKWTIEDKSHTLLYGNRKWLYYYYKADSDWYKMCVACVICVVCAKGTTETMYFLYMMEKSMLQIILLFILFNKSFFFLYWILYTLLLFLLPMLSLLTVYSSPSYLLLSLDASICLVWISLFNFLSSEGLK